MYTHVHRAYYTPKHWLSPTQRSSTRMLQYCVQATVVTSNHKTKTDEPTVPCTHCFLWRLNPLITVSSVKKTKAKTQDFSPLYRMFSFCSYKVMYELPTNVQECYVLTIYKVTAVSTLIGKQVYLLARFLI